MAVDPSEAARLPGGLEVRPARPGEVEAVAALWVRGDVADLGMPDTEPDDIRGLWRRPGYDLERSSVLVLADDRPVAYGDVFEGEGLVDPDWRGRGIGGWLLRRIEELAGDGSSLEVSAPAGDLAFRELVERAGYRRGRSSWLMRLDMDGPPPPPVWPDGVGVRTFDRAADARAVHRLVEDAFADIGNQPPRSYEFWEQVHVERSDFDSHLWFLAVAAGELVGVNLAQSGQLGGYVAQLAVRADQRGRGLGLAPLRPGFGALYRHGVREVYLDVDSENRTGATRLYERAGMRMQHRHDYWVRDPS